MRCMGLFLVVVVLSGCASTSSKWVSLRTTPRNPLTDTLGLVTRQGPKATPRTLQLLRRYDLDEDHINDGGHLLAELNKIDRMDPQREHLYALAELAYVGAKQAERSKNADQAIELYGSSVLYSYRYLFDAEYPEASNPFDPQFRQACDLYNSALEDTLRMIHRQQRLQPGTSLIVKTASHDCTIDIKLKSKGWHIEDFDDIQFVSDYEVHGLRNHYHSYGLGVPLIAVRRHHEGEDPREQYYPPDLSFPVTAFLRVDPNPTTAAVQALNDPRAQLIANAAPGANRHLHAVLELRDPLDEEAMRVAGKTIPMESDLSTPLAHYLSQPALANDTASTTGLLKPEKVASGLFMLEPFQADKIPVVMVHGLWSSPVTWMEMFNDLRSDPAIRNDYQFWFYLYPTGQPFWYSAAQMRKELNEMRASLDPQRQFAALDQTVLVGHSMGGLVSHLQTIDSRNDFWKTVSDRPFSELDAKEEVRDQLAATYFFAPNSSVRRVVTIATPHRGSDVANDVTRWLGRKLIHIPNLVLQRRHELIAGNPGFFRDDAPLGISTSIDSLSPKSPILPVMLASESGPWVKYHNIVGHSKATGFTGAISQWLAGEGDGVVSLESAHFDSAISEIMVPSDHVTVHRHPASILEVRRILLQHLEELRAFPYGRPTGRVDYASHSHGQENANNGSANLTSMPSAAPSVADRSTTHDSRVTRNGNSITASRLPATRPGDSGQPNSTTAAQPSAALVR